MRTFLLLPIVVGFAISILPQTHGFTMINTNNGVPTSHVTFNLQMSTSPETIETETPANPRMEGLALALDSGTRKSHSVAQNTAFVAGFFKGLSTKESYGALLTSLYYVYKAMEGSFDETNEDVVKALDGKELRRLEALEVDLEYFYGSDWRNKLNPSPATKKYVDRILEVAKNQPYLLVAHQYSRYLGDLFGGQMMSGMATRSLDLDTGKGIAFYTFEDIPQANEYITEWYTRLNELDLTDAQKEEIVDEANEVFFMNIKVFEELEGSAAGAFWSFVWNSFKEKIGL